MPYNSERSGLRRSAGFGFVVLLHVLLIWGLANGLGTKVAEIVKGPIEAKIIDTPPEVKPDEPPPPPPVLDKPPPPFVPPPEITIDILAQTPPAKAITAVQSKVAAPSAPSASPRADPDHRNGRPPYPPASIRMGEEGTVVLLLLVGTDGAVDEARVDKSSGFSKLDQAAVKYARRAWRFLPAMSAGTAVAAWHRVAVSFRLDQQ